MAVSSEYREFVLDQLGAIAPVTAKAMFGGVGIYSRGTFFALIDNDTLYFKTDATTRDAYKAAGSQAFDPLNKGPMSYWELPADVLENEDELREWMRAALDVARRK